MENKKNDTRKIKVGFPAGAIKEQTIKLFKLAGYEINFNEKFQKAEIDDEELELFVTRPREIAPYVEQGYLDAGISTTAAILETKSKVENISSLGFGASFWHKDKIVLAVQENSDIKELKDLKGKKIITRIPEITKEFLKENKISADVIFSDTVVNESKVGLSADVAVEFYNRGSALKEYKLKPLAVLMENEAVVVANKKSLEDKWKEEKIKGLGILLKGAMVGQEMVGVMLHAANDMLEKVFKILPSMKKPTVTHLRGENWFDVFTVAKKKEIRKLIPTLKEIGCTDIIEFPLNIVIIDKQAQ